jgi:cytidylate kinase
VICVSRQFGALGGQVGRRVAQRLSFSFYGQELVDEIAKQAHVRREVVESLDERNQDSIRLWVDELMDIRRFMPSDYLRNLSQVVLTLGRHGRSVIIGRGAHLILDPAQTLRVRCVAPFDWRVDQVALNRGLSRVDARDLVRRVDSERATFYAQNFNVNIDDPFQFDMLVNVSTNSVDDVARIVADAFDVRFAERSAAPASVPPMSQVRATGSSAAQPFMDVGGMGRR